MLDAGLLIMRLAVGLLFIGHGAQKLFGWFYGNGVRITGSWFESIGVKPGILMAILTGWVELGGGLMFAAGLLTPLAAVAIGTVMVMAIIKVHGKNRLWNSSGGFEFNLVILAVVIGISMTGAGAYSLDALIF